MERSSFLSGCLLELSLLTVSAEILGHMLCAIGSCEGEYDFKCQRKRKCQTLECKMTPNTCRVPSNCPKKKLCGETFCLVSEGIIQVCASNDN